MRGKLEQVGLTVVEARTMVGTALYGSVEDLVEIEIRGTPLVDRLSESQIEQIRAESREVLGRYRTADGRLGMPIRAHLMAGRRPV